MNDLITRHQGVNHELGSNAIILLHIDSNHWSIQQPM